MHRRPLGYDTLNSGTGQQLQNNKTGGNMALTAKRFPQTVAFRRVTHRGNQLQFLSSENHGFIGECSCFKLEVARLLFRETACYCNLYLPRCCMDRTGTTQGPRSCLWDSTRNSGILLQIVFAFIRTLEGSEAACCHHHHEVTVSNREELIRAREIQQQHVEIRATEHEAVE
jgi:hypothetical protein